MILFYLSIPFMVLGLAVALIPLLWGVAHETRLHDEGSPRTARSALENRVGTRPTP